jgi:hypothetical protein
MPTDQKPTLEYPAARGSGLIRRRISWPILVIAVVLGVGFLSCWFLLIWQS